MDRFVMLTVIGKLGNRSERVFNLRYVKAFDVENSTVVLYGNKKPFTVSPESMYKLLKIVLPDEY